MFNDNTVLLIYINLELLITKNIPRPDTTPNEIASQNIILI